MVEVPQRGFVLDSNVLIDFAKTDASVLKLFGEKIGPTYVILTLLEEVHDIDEGGCRKVGLRIYEASTEQLMEAASPPSGLSRYDNLCFIVARDEGLTCITHRRQTSAGPLRQGRCGLHQGPSPVDHAGRGGRTEHRIGS